jgi:hypothetical protein
MELSPETVSVVVGLGLTNVVSIFGAYVSLRVSNAELRILVGKLEKDVNNLGEIYRAKLLNNERKEI